MNKRKYISVLFCTPKKKLRLRKRVTLQTNYPMMVMKYMITQQKQMILKIMTPITKAEILKRLLKIQICK